MERRIGASKRASGEAAHVLLLCKYCNNLNNNTAIIIVNTRLLHLHEHRGLELPRSELQVLIPDNMGQAIDFTVCTSCTLPPSSYHNFPLFFLLLKIKFLGESCANNPDVSLKWVTLCLAQQNDLLCKKWWKEEAQHLRWTEESSGATAPVMVMVNKPIPWNLHLRPNFTFTFRVYAPI